MHYAKWFTLLSHWILRLVLLLFPFYRWSNWGSQTAFVTDQSHQVNDTKTDLLNNMTVLLLPEPLWQKPQLSTKPYSSLPETWALVEPMAERQFPASLTNADWMAESSPTECEQKPCVSFGLEFLSEQMGLHSLLPFSPGRCRQWLSPRGWMAEPHNGRGLGLWIAKWRTRCLPKHLL